MISYKKWKDKILSVPNLLLDSENPRLPEAEETLSQNELIAELIKHEKIYDLAKNISEKGYFPVEALIGVEKENKVHVLEGNRRLAALKLLISPDIAPDSQRKKFKILADKIDANSIKNIKVTIAPSRQAATPVIMSKHTEQQIAKWIPIQQAKFYKQLSESGQSIDDIALECATSTREVAEYLQSYDMYQVACCLDLPEDIANIVRDSRRFPITTFERLYRQSDVQKFLSIGFDKQKKLVGNVNPEEFKKGLSKMVTDVATKDIDSRAVNDKKGISNYLSKIKEFKPNKRRKGQFTAESIIADTMPDSIPKQSSKAPAVKKRRAFKALIPPSFKCAIDNQRINAIFLELRKLHVDQYPNAVAILLRCLLDMSMSHYLDKTGLLRDVIKKVTKGQPCKKTWHPTLKQMLNYILEQRSEFNLNPQAIKTIQALTSRKDTILSSDTLDYYVHNQYYWPSENELRTLWDALSEIFKIILIEPYDEGELD